MTSRLETSGASKMLDNKIRIMLGSLNKDFANFESTTKEDVITSFSEIVQKFYSTIGKPLFSYRKFRQGKTPNIEEINQSFKSAEEDLKIFYTELSSIRNALTSNFNALSGLTQKIKSDIAMASSELFDYKIQNTNKIQPTFSDYFFDLSKVESEDKAYDKEKAFVDVANNRVVFPLNGEAENLKVKRVQIAENSIGTPGNNQEVRAVARDNLQLLADNNMDTWFEFEQVSLARMSNPTVLGLKIEFDEEKIFNILEVAPVSFPTGAYPAISALTGSVDGSIFFDLFPFYLGKIETDSSGNKIIQLGANPSNPTDANMLAFAPKKIKYLNVKLIEDSSYFIQTSSGKKYRNAIGIKEIKAKSQKYKNEGQLISSNYITEKEISKISISTEEVLPQGFESEFKYYISVDSGKEWVEIGPTQKISEIDEVLNYNLDYLKESKDTEIPVYNIKLKSDMTLASSEKQLSVGSNSKKIEKTEFKTLGSSSTIVPLSEEPIDSVDLFELGFGSIGGGPSYRFTSAQTQNLENKIVATLPNAIFTRDQIEKDQEEVFSDGLLWARVDDISVHDASEMVYEFDYRNNIITFYFEDGAGDRHGKKPNNGIFMRLKRENILFTKEDKEAIVNTVYGTDGISENIMIYTVKDEELEKEVRLRNKATVHRLGIDEIQMISIVQDVNSKLSSVKTYLNGVMELETAGDYCLDYSKGILYTFSEIDNNEDIRILVTYLEKTEITPRIVAGKITIPVESYETTESSFSIDIPSITYVVDIGFKNIEKGSIQFSNISSTVETEVKYNEMESSFNDSSISNPYAIDYRKGLLYVKEGISGLLSGVLSRGDYYIEYRIARKIPRTDYTIQREEKTVTFTDQYVSSSYVQSQNQEVAPSGFYRVEYEYAEEIEEPSKEMMPYTTPILRGYKITAVPKETLI